MSQNQQIMEHLKRHGSLTPIQALNRYGVMRLAARVEELRSKGHGIETHIVSRKGKRYARYTWASKR